MDMLTFFVISAFVGAWGALIYFYSKKLGNGVPAAAWNDPNDRKRLFIVAGGSAVLFIIMLLGLHIGSFISLW